MSTLAAPGWRPAVAATRPEPRYPQARLAPGRALPRVPALVGARTGPGDLLRDGDRDGRHPASAGSAARAARLHALAAVPGLDARRGVPRAGHRPGHGARAAASAGWPTSRSGRGWYLAITVAMLYVANTARTVSTQRIVRLLGWMFVVTTSLRRARRAGPDAASSSPRWSWSSRTVWSRRTSCAP